MKQRRSIRKVSVIMLFVLCCTSFFSFAQDKSDQPNTNHQQEKPKKKFEWNRVMIGGGLGLQFGDITRVDLSPLVGYRFTDQLHAGVGITYQYLKFNGSRFYRSFETHVYGGSVFCRYLFSEFFFAHSEIEILNLEAFDIMRRRVDVTSIFIGGGYVQPIGGHSYLMLMLLWNINESVYSPYTNPIMRVGINIGL